MRKRKVLSVGAGVALLSSVVLAVAAGASAASPRVAQPMIARGGHVSSIARPETRLAAAPNASPATDCMTPGGTNYQADCNSSGNPVNETSIATNGSTFVAGANDYNSYNGNADLGYYTSTDAMTWTDNGPLHLFPDGTLHAAGDPGLAIDNKGVSYYSSIFFDYSDCNVGGVELARRDPRNDTWSYYQISPNSDTQFMDKPAIMQDGRHVFVSWTFYGSCDGIGVTSPIKIAVFNTGPTSGPPIKLVSVPGSVYSQGSAMASDGHGGFWITWEEYPDPFATVGSIKLAHWRNNKGWSAPRVISPDGFTDLPSPLPWFLFRTDSFPAIAFANGQPNVVWTSYDTGAGRCYLYSNGTVTMVSNQGGDQFFPSVAADANGDLAISFSEAKTSNVSYDQYLVYLGATTRITTSSSFPNNDPFFGGAFIGDYNSTAVLGTTAHPIWTDVRAPTYAQNAMVYSP